MARLPGDMPSVDTHELGERIKAAREECGWSTSRLAERIGVHRSTINRIEAGEQRPSPDLLQQLAEALELDETDLFALAGYRLSKRLPAFSAYLRAKYRMPETAAKQLDGYFAFLSEKYDIHEDGDVPDGRFPDIY